MSRVVLVHRADAHPRVVRSIPSIWFGASPGSPPEQINAADDIVAANSAALAH